MEAARQPSGSRIKRGLPFAVIVVASALAHLWCLQSQFYMDDMPGIQDNVLVKEGLITQVGLTGYWTFLCYIIQYKIFGTSPVGFHAVNWLLHTSVACVLFGFGRDFLRNRMPAGVAWFAALLFVVHPLASEIPNYARTQDLAWVTLFSLLAAWSMLKWLQGGGWFFLLGVGLGVAGATMSKGPGMFHAAMMVAAVGLAFLNPERWVWMRQRVWWFVGVFAITLTILWSAGLLTRFWISVSQWNEPRFVGHAFTLGRVFWEFFMRAVVPVSLCSDHQIAETLVPPGSGWFGVPDRQSMIAAYSMLALTAFSLWLSWNRKTRLFGVCLFLFTATILFRVLYLIPEFMPEYRIYPGMPWFCLGMAILAAALWKRIPGGGSPAWMGVLLLAVFSVLSAKRSFVWHNTETLCADVLRQYPAQARAVWELHDHSMARGEWEKIIYRQQTLWPVVFQSFIKQSKQLAPERDLNSGHFAMADVACNGRYAIALAHVNGPRAGIAEMMRLEAKMKQLAITPETNRVICGYFHHARAVVMEMAGAYPQALESMRFQGVYKITEADIKRVERKLEEASTPNSESSN